MVGAYAYRCLPILNRHAPSDAELGRAARPSCATSTRRSTCTAVRVAAARRWSRRRCSCCAATRATWPRRGLLKRARPGVHLHPAQSALIDRQCARFGAPQRGKACRRPRRRSVRSQQREHVQHAREDHALVLQRRRQEAVERQQNAAPKQNITTRSGRCIRPDLSSMPSDSALARVYETMPPEPSASRHANSVHGCAAEQHRRAGQERDFAESIERAVEEPARARDLPRHARDAAVEVVERHAEQADHAAERDAPNAMRRRRPPTIRSTSRSACSGARAPLASSAHERLQRPRVHLAHGLADQHRLAAVLHLAIERQLAPEQLERVVEQETRPRSTDRNGASSSKDHGDS